ncbi:MAG: molybdopterin oxidoreductase family protein [Candidatus Rokubacteria bacterium]|nr:molybdopterin oxidoreductase family protein [Candidatus Rokubacteria bacterium]MBI3826627.1 molybdopterin oxidoreductase family protein [Candidatus Rokubacteria bacterium]
MAAMRSVCPHDCPSCCSLEVSVENGRITTVVGDPHHPFTRGVICGKVHAYAERVHSPLRVREPLRRVGPKGAGVFESASWDDAVAEIARRWRGIIAAHGGEAILPFSYAGTMGQVQFHAGHPLFHALGASLLDRTICVTTAYAGWKATVGAVTGNDSEQMVGADLIVLWGINAAYSTINVMTLVKAARARGARVMCIDPYRTPTAAGADEHLMVRPGTDGALALAVMHVLIGEGLVDRDYVDRATVGFEALAEHVKAWPPERAAAICGLPAERIVTFARRYGASPRTFIRIGIGLSRHDNGGMTCRTLACLPALTGAYADPHGGALLSTGGAFGLGFAALERPDLMPMPAPRIVNMIQLGRALTDPAMAPPVKGLYVYNSNPAAVCPDQNVVLRGLAREDLFTVVHEQVLTDTTRWADIVLPATTSMEHEDLYRSFGHLYLQLAEPVLPPQGQARSNWETFGLLARAMGVAGEAYAKPVGQVIDEALAAGDETVRGITYDQLARERSVRINVPRPYLPFAHGAPTPSGKVELYSEALATAGLPALPTWMPLLEGPDDVERARRYPLQCIVPPNRFFLNSSFSQSDLLRSRQKTPTVMLAAEDAAARGVRDGDEVRVFNDRGAARFTARITDATRPGVAVIEGIWWHRFHPGGAGVNVLTSDRTADMGGGPALHSNLVEIAAARHRSPA